MIKDLQTTFSALHSPSDESGSDYWQAQSQSLRQAKNANQKWRQKRRSGGTSSANSLTWKRVTFALPREQAQIKAKEFLTKYPKAAYWSEVESWRELPDDIIEFTMRRLPSAD